MEKKVSVSLILSQGREGSRTTLEKEVSGKGIREEDGFIVLC